MLSGIASVTTVTALVVALTAILPSTFATALLTSLVGGMVAAILLFAELALSALLAMSGLARLV